MDEKSCPPAPRITKGEIMLKKLHRTPADRQHLSKLSKHSPSAFDDANYKGFIINKPWGYEYLIFQNSHVAVWVLFLKYNHATSLHCHPTKKTSLTVLSGKIQCEILHQKIVRSEGEGVLIDKAVFHSSKSISKNGSFVIEIETPPNKKDLVRLKDRYGRELKEYEGITHMSKDKKKYVYIDFHNENFVTETSRKIKNCTLSILSFTKKESIQNVLHKERTGILTVLQGKLQNSRGKILLSVGESVVLQDILKRKINITKNGIILIIHHETK